MRIFIAFIFLFFIFADYANASDSTIRCPSIDALHQASNAIYDAEFSSGSYIVGSAPSTIHTADMGWFAVIYNIQAISINDAIDKARLTMLSVSSLSSEYAEELAGNYVCKYDGGKIEVINDDYN